MFGGITIIWVQLRGAAQGAPARVVCGAGLLVPLQSAASLSVVCALWSLPALKLACWYRFRLPLQCGVRVACALWSWHAGARCRVLLQTAASGCWPGSAAARCRCRVSERCALWSRRAGAAAGCRCKLLLQGAAAKWRVRCGGGLPVPLQCAVGVSMLGAAAECAAVRVWCCCRVRV